MTQQTKTDIIRHFRKPYGRASKAERSRILNIVIESTGYSRKHAIALLTGPAVPRIRPRRSRSSRYAHLCDILIRIWAASNYAQRLLARDDVPKETKTLLNNTFMELNPVTLLYAIYDLVEELYNTLPK